MSRGDDCESSVGAGEESGKGVSGQRVCLTDYSSVLLKVIRFRLWYL